MMDVKTFGDTCDGGHRLLVQVRMRRRFLFKVYDPERLLLDSTSGGVWIKYEIGLDRAKELRDRLNQAIEYADPAP